MASATYLGEPAAAQLVEAVARYLEEVAVPKLEGHAAFHGRVAINVLNIVAREIADGPRAAAAERARLAALLGDEADLETLRRTLCARLASGEMTLDSPGLAAHLLETAADRVRIEQPNYASLKRL
jgi:hypothetical protein